MNDNDLFSHDDIERMLTPRCSFRASDSLKNRIAGNVSAAPRKRFRPSLPWSAAAACAAAVIVGAMFLPGTGPHHAPESEVMVASASQPQAPATPPDAAIPAETGGGAEATPTRPVAERRKQIHDTATPDKEIRDDGAILHDDEGYRDLFNFDLADEKLFNTDDFSYGDEEVYAMIDVAEPNTFPMKTTPEERIRMQREESLKYLDRARQELRECRAIYLQLQTLQ